MADILVKMSEKEREESKVREVLEKKQKFDAIANTMCEVGGYGTRIWLDCFRKEKDGGIQASLEAIHWRAEYYHEAPNKGFKDCVCPAGFRYALLGKLIYG